MLCCEYCHSDYYDTVSERPPPVVVVGVVIGVRSEKMGWHPRLTYDPVPTLLESKDERIRYFVRRDVLRESVPEVTMLWELPSAARIAKRQQSDGRWIYPNPKEHVRSAENYDLYETFLQLGKLVEMHGVDRRHPVTERAAEYLLQRQTAAGDIRGIYWNQYSPNYTAGIVELLTKVGYGGDPRVHAALDWLISMRQDDGGWVIPARTTNAKLAEWMTHDTIEPDRSRPFSYMVTGVVLRAFAYNPATLATEKTRTALLAAAELVLSRLFKADFYPDRKAADYWIKFTFPYNFTDLLAVLDPVAHLEFPADHPQVRYGLEWFVREQKSDGGWAVKTLKGKRPEQLRWIALGIARLFRRFDLPPVVGDPPDAPRG